jgi:hypothetical protein
MKMNEICRLLRKRLHSKKSNLVSIRQQRWKRDVMGREDSNEGRNGCTLHAGMRILRANVAHAILVCFIHLQLVVLHRRR